MTNLFLIRHGCSKKLAGIAGFPLLVPILMVFAAVASVGVVVAGAVWAGSRSGRPWMERIAKPVYEKLGREDPEVRFIRMYSLQ